MPTFLSDPPLGVYLVLLVGVLAAVGVWWRRRTRPTVVAVMVAGGLLLALFGLDRAVESPREECVRKVRAMGAAANARDWSGVAAHVGDGFQYAGRGKAAFLADVPPVAARYNATVNFAHFDRDNFTELPGGRVRIGFVSQFSTPEHGTLALYAEAEFGPEAGGVYRLQKLALYDYITRTQGGEVTLPGLR